jgi:hypothetical protein
MSDPRRPRQPASWPSKELVWAAVDALVATRLARGPERQAAARASGRAVDAALELVPPELHAEARRDWGAWADAEVQRAMRGRR